MMAPLLLPRRPRHLRLRPLRQLPDRRRRRGLHGYLALVLSQANGFDGSALTFKPGARGTAIDSFHSHGAI